MYLYLSLYLCLYACLCVAVCVTGCLCHWLSVCGCLCVAVCVVRTDRHVESRSLCKPEARRADCLSGVTNAHNELRVAESAPPASESNGAVATCVLCGAL